jgi:hypothetical protein
LKPSSCTVNNGGDFPVGTFGGGGLYDDDNDEDEDERIVGGIDGICMLSWNC